MHTHVLKIMLFEIARAIAISGEDSHADVCEDSKALFLCSSRLARDTPLMEKVTRSGVLCQHGA